MDTFHFFTLALFVVMVNVRVQETMGLPIGSEAPNKPWEIIWKHIKADDKLFQDFKARLAKEGELPSTTTTTTTRPTTATTTRPTTIKTTTLDLEHILTPNKLSEISYLLDLINDNKMKLSDKEKLALLKNVFSPGSSGDKDTTQATLSPQQPTASAPVVSTTKLAIPTTKLATPTTKKSFDFDKGWEWEPLPTEAAPRVKQGENKTPTTSTPEPTSLLRTTTEVAESGLEKIYDFEQDWEPLMKKDSPKHVQQDESDNAAGTTQEPLTGTGNDEHSSISDDSKLTPDQEWELFLLERKNIEKALRPTSSPKPTTMPFELFEQNQNPTETEKKHFEDANTSWNQMMEEIKAHTPSSKIVSASSSKTPSISTAPSKSILESTKESGGISLRPSAMPNMEDYKTREEVWNANFQEIVNGKSATSAQPTIQPRKTTAKPSLEAKVENKAKDDWIAEMQEFLDEDMRRRHEKSTLEGENGAVNNGDLQTGSNSATSGPISKTFSPSTASTITVEDLTADERWENFVESAKTSTKTSKKELTADERWVNFVESAKTSTETSKKELTADEKWDEFMKSGSTETVPKEATADEQWEKFLKKPVSSSERTQADANGVSEEKVTASLLSHDSPASEKKPHDFSRPEPLTDGEKTDTSVDQGHQQRLVLMVVSAGSGALFVLICLVVCVLCGRHVISYCWKKEKHNTILNTDGNRWDPHSFRPTKENMNAFMYSIPMPLDGVTAY